MEKMNIFNPLPVPKKADNKRKINIRLAVSHIFRTFATAIIPLQTSL
ncbi:MAG: hypothetical protein IJ527_00700 [Prevotella sp.]|nr:hypothetical protein [Prevotella sp.]